MSKNKLNPEERKIKISITIDPHIFKIIDSKYNNKSKYIEKLIFNDINGKN
jgi:hypothetical protein